MKEVFISWEDQLDYLEANTRATKCMCYETLRDDMWTGLRQQYGINARFEMEEIPEEELRTFLEWLALDEEEES